MKKIKLCISTVIFLFIFSILWAYSQEGMIEKAPYVEPGNVTVNFKDADIRAVLHYLSEVGGVDIVPSPDVSGPVTLKLTDKPWEVALDIIVKNYGFAYEREGGIIRVITLSSLKMEEVATEIISLNYASAEESQEAVKDMLTDRGKLSYDSRINALIITDLATNIYKIKQIVSGLDRKTPQIMIEAKIIETALNKTEKLGIDWNLVIRAAGAKRPTTLPFANETWREILPHGLQRFYPFGQTAGTDVDTTALTVSTSTLGEFPEVGAATSTLFPYAGASLFTYGTLDFSQFSAVLEYLKARSNTSIISNPRITTLNNKEAKMFVGKVYNYIAEIEEKEDAGGSERWEYTIEKEEIGIRLLVTPHVNAKGDIEVEVKPEIKDVIGFQQVTEFFSLPIFTTREAETRVMVRDNDTIFIGGLIKENINEYDSKFPILGDLFGDIPLLGNMFKYKRESREKTELVFFLTVHIVKDLHALSRKALENMSEIKVVLNADELVEAETARKSKEFLVVPAFEPVAEKEHKPLFDFRKRK